jgi:glycosyltransferase involved in cell wall biosynthesis
LFIALGETGPDEQIGAARIRFVPHQKNPEDVAAYYQAADIYVHAAVADTFPRAVLEALACGTAVVASSVGGIPEQVRDWGDGGSPASTDATGILVPPGNASRMAAAIHTLLTNPRMLHGLSSNAAMDARRRFDLLQQSDAYLEWYEQLVHPPHARSVESPYSSAHRMLT